MRIVIVASYAPSLIIFRGCLLKALVGGGHEVFACAPRATPTVVNKLKEMRVEHRNLPLHRAGTNPFCDGVTIGALALSFRRLRPDLILAYTAKPVIYAAIASRIAFRTRVYGMVTGLGYAFGGESDRQRFIGRLVRKMYKVALKNMAGVFFQKQDDRDIFLQKGLVPSGVPVTVVNGSGVDIDHYCPVPMPQEPVFLLIARLLTDKGIREYVEAARRVKVSFPEARFQLAGWLDSNPMSIRPQELDGWQKEGVIEYLGSLEDVRPALTSARFYVLPSYREGTPRTVLEAMAMGRPVITTDAPGCRETVIDGENGFLVPVKNVELLKEAMEKLLRNPKLAEQMGQAGLRMAREKYDVHKVNAVILEAMGL